MRGLDLVISVDSMSAHLAGALGVPTWTLLTQCADWRWMEQRNDTPWYPTMRLFRQAAPGDWGSVLESVSQALMASSDGPGGGAGKVGLISAPR
jgi:ADP-heptose:LPS heptosyltransferase